MYDLIKNSIVFAHRDESISDVVRLMNQKHVSSVLIHDDGNKIVGILTERDIIRKFVLLDLDLKWGKKVATIMSFPVCLVRMAHLEQDVIRLHFEKNMRHFPVVSGDGTRMEDVVGMITVTDLCREYLRNRHSQLGIAVEIED